MEEDATIRRVLACCYAVYRALGPGYAETTYQRALIREMENSALAFACAVRLPVHYLGEEIDQVEADFVVERVLLEIRARQNLEKEDISQTLATLKASGLARGLIANFGADELQVRRLNLTPRATI